LFVDDGAVSGDVLDFTVPANAIFIQKIFVQSCKYIQSFPYFILHA
jgi:hypothetical protein